MAYLELKHINQEIQEQIKYITMSYGIMAKFTKMRSFSQIGSPNCLVDCGNFHRKVMGKITQRMLTILVFEWKVFGKKVGTADGILNSNPKKKITEIRCTFRDWLPRQSCVNQKLIFSFRNFNEAGIDRNKSHLHEFILHFGPS